jgi:hypothetical protein
MPETEPDALLSYVREQGGRYSPEALREQLVAQGHAPEYVDATLSLYLRERRERQPFLAGWVLLAGAGLAFLCVVVPRPILASPLLSALLESFIDPDPQNRWYVAMLLPLVSAIPAGLLTTALGVWKKRAGVARAGLVLTLAALWLGALGMLASGGFSVIASLFVSGEQREHIRMIATGLVPGGLVVIGGAIGWFFVVSAALKRLR